MGNRNDKAGLWAVLGPGLFADTWGLLNEPRDAAGDEAATRPIDARSATYRGYLLALAIVPMAGLFWRFQKIQKLYAIVGATFIPFLAIALLILNGCSEWVGRQYRNRPATVAVLLATLAFFMWIAWRRFVG